MTDRRPSGMLAVELIKLWAETSGLDVHENVLAGSGAVFSACGTWRYLLWRGASGSRTLTGFAMLNPSTADHSQDDPTIRRCLGWSNGTGLLVWNLFALRATDPGELRAARDPVGPAGDAAMKLALGLAAPTIAAWGVHGVLGGREHAVRRHVAAQGGKLMALKLTKDGHPGHPLYLPGSVQPEPWDFDF